MKRITESIKNNWRKLFSMLFIMAVFTMPGTKSFFDKFFSVDAKGKNQQNNQGNQNVSSTGGSTHSNGSNSSGGSTSKSTGSMSFSSNSVPSTGTTASRVLPPTGGCSTGKKHSKSHHGHHRATHAHYR